MHEAHTAHCHERTNRYEENPHLSDDLLTIGEAAIQLGVSQSRVRRALNAMPEYAARTRQAERQTRTGMRMSTVLPLDLVWDLQSFFALEAAPAAAPPPRSAKASRAAKAAAPPRKPAEDEIGGEPESSARSAQDSEPLSGQLTHVEAQLRMFYERLDSQRQEQIADLRAALDHERGLVRSLADSLAREQSLRLLDSTRQPAEEMPVDTPADEPASEPAPPAEDEPSTETEPSADSEAAATQSLQTDPSADAEPPMPAPVPSWQKPPDPQTPEPAQPAPSLDATPNPPRPGLWRRLAKWLSDEPGEG